MNEIKFRARLTKDGKPWMFYQDNQYLISFLRRCTSFIAFEKDSEEGRHESYLDAYALEKCLDQYTGLKDKNGKEIYEGDILANPNGYNGHPSIVKWDNEGAYFHIFRGETSSGYTLKGEVSRTEVIGNIYENPNENK